MTSSARNDTSLVVDGDLLGRFRVEFAQLLVQRPPVRCNLGLERAAPRGRCRELHMIDRGTHVEPGPADEDRPQSALPDVRIAARARA